MALDTPFADLALRLALLHDGVLLLRLTVVEDRPLAGAGALLDRLGEAVLDLESWLGEASEQAARGRRASDTACEALVACQERFLRFQRGFSAEIAGCERVAEIATLGRERGGEWAGWARSVQSAVDQAQTLTLDVNEALFHCFREMAEKPTAKLERT